MEIMRQYAIIWEKEFSKMNLAGKCAVLTGGASGIALACAKSFARQGARVVLADYNGDAAEKEAAALRQEGFQAIACRTDVRKHDEVENCVRLATETFGAVDILVNCAGGNSARVRGYGANWHEASYEDIEWGLDVNLKGAMFFCRAVLPGMIARQQGVIVNMASVNAYVGTTFGCDYSAAKHGLIGLTKSIALCGAPHHVRCVGVAPGPVLTREAMSRMTTPLGRAAEVSEVVDLIGYLVSDKAAFVTGSTHVIDGGFTCR